MAKKLLHEHNIAKSPARFYNGCVGKKGHPSRKVAKAVARAMGDSLIRVYKCRFCGNWHLGH